MPGFVHGDPGRTRQVPSNLVGNAVKFTASGEVVVEIDIAESDDDGMLLCIAVRDTGIGIDEQACRNIFDPFTQADGSTTRRFGGTGLGLTISRRLAHMMAGEIGVSSQPGVGSRFWFTLRVGRCAQRETAAAPVLAGRRVLVVDDHPTNLEILQHQLAAGAMHACGAGGAAQALDQLDTAQQPFDLAILDMHMPGTDGLALAERIRGQPRFNALRLVMLSSIGCDLPRERMARLDISGWLTKPVGAAQLLRVLEQALGGTPSRNPSHPTEALHCRFQGRVLLAEDNDVNRLVAVTVLESFGLQVDVAANGREAVVQSARRHYDLLLMDCQMPEMDGFAATEAIRARESGGARCVIVALTALAMVGDNARCRAAGMDDYLSKPFLREELLALLQRWLPQVPTLEA